VLSRDILVTCVAIWCTLVLRRPDAFGHMRPRLPGKITTSLVFFWLIALLANAPVQMIWILFALAAVSSLIAAGDYLRVFVLKYQQSQTEH
jgi:hypothetical protein